MYFHLCFDQNMIFVYVECLGFAPIKGIRLPFAFVQSSWKLKLKKWGMDIYKVVPQFGIAKCWFGTPISLGFMVEIGLETTVTGRHRLLASWKERPAHLQKRRGMLWSDCRVMQWSPNSSAVSFVSTWSWTSQYTQDRIISPLLSVSQTWGTLGTHCF